MILMTGFHPALRNWFERKLGRPTEVQSQAWPAIAQGKHTLIAAPTGSGKTLAAFYSVINGLMVRGLAGTLPQQTQVVYVSPLKALSNDIHRNLELPLAGVEETLEELGQKPVKISVAVRTGDTASSERQKLLKKPPHILVTTPESLYIMLTSEGGRASLKHVQTLIVDEIHALVGDKRGSHLSLSIQRLEALTGKPVQRIGLSATQKPIELIAKFLAPDCVVVDTGYRRTLDLHLEVPKSPLTAVMSNEVWTEIYERLVDLIRDHKTTLIFVNTRRLAERLARALAERIGEEHVSSHHGSMSKEHRHSAERRLKAGQLKVLVATASMELGIDIGSVNLVVQISSPKRIAAFLQRVGRSGHYVGGTPKGILIPLSRDDLMEGAALFDSVRRGELDRMILPEAPLDVLSQQIVAEVSAREWDTEELFDLFRKAYPYRKLERKSFDDVVRMLAEGYTTRRGRKGAYLHYDAVNGRLRARRGARLAALTNGGAIPDMFDYEVVLQPEGITVGSLNEDFALESLAGDIFTLGTHSWQLVRIEGLKVYVHDAAGKPPSVPFWLGESFARSEELSESVSRLRQTVSDLLDQEPLPEFAAAENENVPVSITEHRAVRWLTEEVKISQAAAEQLVLYLWMGKTGLGGMVPTRENIVLERFFDETGDMHLVVHSPYGSRVNRGWGLALRKKFCRIFNFELQAAADENAIILSLSSSHSFPLEEVSKYLNSKTLRETLIQAMLDTPFFEIRWRWNATRSLAILRNRAGKRVPPQFQRMAAEDLIAQVFPDQIACAENLTGPVRIPEHPLVEQVVEDCLNEAMEIDSLEKLIKGIEKGDVRLTALDLREPSVFAQEILNARPYAFLDDTPFEERRSIAVRNRGWLDPAEARDLSKLDPQAVEGVKEEAWPEARNADELHDALMIHGFVTEEEGRPWKDFFETLAEHKRAARLFAKDEIVLWVTAERLPLFRAVYPAAEFKPKVKVPEIMERDWPRAEALREIIRGRMEALGPVTIEKLSCDSGLSPDDIKDALLALETEGFVFRGDFTADDDAAPASIGRSDTAKIRSEFSSVSWCERRLLQRIHRYTLESLRQSIQPVSVQDYMRFLFQLHHMDTDETPAGPQGLQKILEQLEGFEAPAAAWESDLIPSRIADYDPVWLDVLCVSGKIVWGRFHLPKGKDGSASGPVKNTPLSLVARPNIPLWRGFAEPAPAPSALSGKAMKILEHLRANGASFFDDIVVRTGLLQSQAEEGIAELVSNGLIASDSYSGLRALLVPQAIQRNRRRRPLFGLEHAGRWSLVDNLTVKEEETVRYESMERAALIYLKRWGVLFRSVMEKESFAPPWRDLVRVLRRMELRGELRGGRFVSQVSGEQFALPETIERLRKVRAAAKNGKLISISAADPLNLAGILLPGKRVAKLASNRILFQDGTAVAVLEGKETKFLKKFAEAEEWEAKKTLLRGKFPPKLRYYLGKI